MIDILRDCSPTGDARQAVELADAFERAGDRRLAASAIDRAHGLAPDDSMIRDRRARMLDELAVVEHGMHFRYIPAGTSLMGSDVGDPDERPVHPAFVDGFWLAETTMSWGRYLRLMGWDEESGIPPEEQRAGLDRMVLFYLQQANKIRLQYCEDETLRAGDWHSHDPHLVLRDAQGRTIPGKVAFGAPPRSAEAPYRYDQKPMVAVAWQEAEELCARLTTPAVEYRLPTEAEWERAARGGLIGKQYSWGDELPTSERCDFGRFDAFSILPFRTHPPNGYGLHAMCGSVWEWTNDAYDALAYTGARMPEGPLPRTAANGAPLTRAGGLPERALRGGSWADSAEAVTVSFRMSRGSVSWRSGEWGDNLAPNIGFRVARFERGGIPQQSMRGG